MIGKIKTVLLMIGIITFIVVIPLKAEGITVDFEGVNMNIPEEYSTSAHDFTIKADEIIEAMNVGYLEELVKEKARLKILVKDQESGDKWVEYQGAVEIFGLDELVKIATLETTTNINTVTIGFYPGENIIYDIEQALKVEVKVIGKTKPVDPTDPVDPVDPTDPVDPVDPVDPLDPLDPVDPVDPVGPADSVNPINSVDPLMEKVTVKNQELKSLEAIATKKTTMQESTRKETTSAVAELTKEGTLSEEMLLDNTVESINDASQNEAKKLASKDEAVIKPTVILWYQGGLLLGYIALGSLGISIAGDIRVLRWYNNKKRGR